MENISTFSYFNRTCVFLSSSSYNVRVLDHPSIRCWCLMLIVRWMGHWLLAWSILFLSMETHCDPRAWTMWIGEPYITSTLCKICLHFFQTITKHIELHSHASPSCKLMVINFNLPLIHTDSLEEIALCDNIPFKKYWLHQTSMLSM